jgi:hypothetical protein
MKGNLRLVIYSDRKLDYRYVLHGSNPMVRGQCAHRMANLRFRSGGSNSRHSQETRQQPSMNRCHQLIPIALAPLSRTRCGDNRTFSRAHIAQSATPR